MLKLKRVRWVIALLTGLVFALIFTLSGVFTAFELSSFDLRVRTFATGPEEDSPIFMIYLSQASLDWGDEYMGWSWPWPREAYGAIIDYLSNGGAKSIAMDVLYTEPSIYGVFDDQAHADAISYAGNTIQAIVLNQEESQSLPDSVQEGFIQRSLLTNNEGLKTFKGATLPISEILDTGSVLGNVESDADQDGIFRRVHLLGAVGDTLVPSFGLAAYTLSEEPLDTLLADGSLRFDDYLPPVDRNGASILRYRGPKRSFENLDAHQVINSWLQVLEGSNPEYPAEIFEGKNVFFGFSAPGLLDLRPSPTEASYPGVEIHATVFDNIINQSFITESGTLFNILYMIVLLGLAALVVRGGLSSIPMYFTVLLPLLVGLLAYALGYWVRVVEPNLAVLFYTHNGCTFELRIGRKTKAFHKSCIYPISQ
jgi:adenylate cyclase